MVGLVVERAVDAQDVSAAEQVFEGDLLDGGDGLCRGVLDLVLFLPLRTKTQHFRDGLEARSTCSTQSDCSVTLLPCCVSLQWNGSLRFATAEWITAFLCSGMVTAFLCSEIHLLMMNVDLLGHPRIS